MITPVHQMHWTSLLWRSVPLLEVYLNRAHSLNSLIITWSYLCTVRPEEVAHGTQ